MRKSIGFNAMAIVAVVFYFISNKDNYLLLGVTSHMKEFVYRNNVICSDTGSTLLAAGGCSQPLSQQLKYLTAKTNRYRSFTF